MIDIDIKKKQKKPNDLDLINVLIYKNQAQQKAQP